MTSWAAQRVRYEPLLLLSPWGDPIVMGWSEFSRVKSTECQQKMQPSKYHLNDKQLHHLVTFSKWSWSPRRLGTKISLECCVWLIRQTLQDLQVTCLLLSLSRRSKTKCNWNMPFQCLFRKKTNKQEWTKIHTKPVFTIFSFQTILMDRFLNIVANEAPRQAGYEPRPAVTPENDLF